MGKGLTEKWRFSLLAARGMVILPALLCVLCSFRLYAQSVWTLESDENGAQAVLDVTLLETLPVGDSFPLLVTDGNEYTIRIDRHFELANGDRTWYGTITRINSAEIGLDYALVITVGNKTAHLILTSPSGIFQLYGTSVGGGLYAGRFNQLQHVRDGVATTDTILLSGDDDQVSTPGNQNQAFSADKTFSITQSVSEGIAPVGITLNFNLDFSYTGSNAVNDQYVYVYFVLENTSLDSLPDGCEILETTETEPQPVLSCYLGEFSNGQKKQLAFSVTTSEASHPSVTSAAIIGDDPDSSSYVRSDLFVELYRDVVTDTDQDGVSDYNEQLLGRDPNAALVTEEERTAVIDVLALYTPDISDLYQGEVETRVNQLFNVANKIFEDSRTGIRLRAVGLREVNYTPAASLLTDLSNVTYKTDDSFKDLDKLRELTGGDVVVLFRTGEINGICGLANLGGSGTRGDLSADYHKTYAYSVINIDCRDDSVLAHEIGHNLGLVHSRREDVDGGTLPYSAGYGVDTRFVTVMAFPDDFDVVNRLYRFSDPRRACGQYQCGADAGDATEGADAVGSLRLVKHQVAAYYPSQESRIASMKAVSSLSGKVPADIGVAAYTGNSAEFTNYFSGDDPVNFRIKITPLPEHVGKDFVTHLVIVDGNQNLLQANDEGRLVTWSGDINELVWRNSPRAMNDSELFDVLEGLDLKEYGLTDQTLHVFVAYHMVESRELIYGTPPLTLLIGGSERD